MIFLQALDICKLDKRRKNENFGVNTILRLTQCTKKKVFSEFTNIGSLFKMVKIGNYYDIIHVTRSRKAHSDS